MKHILCFLLLTVSILQAQVGIGTTSPEATSQLDLTSTTKGFLVPRMTATQKDAISSPATGLLIYQTDGSAGFYYYTGSVWISSASASLTSLDVLSDAKVEGTNFTGSMLLGHQTTGSLTGANYNTGVGIGAMPGLTSGDKNTAMGYFALNENTVGIGNTAIGSYSLNGNVAGNYGIAIGYESMKYGNSASSSFSNSNVAVGYQSLRGSTTAINNIGNRNIAIGSSSLLENTSGDDNSAIGYETLRKNTTGSSNVAIGKHNLFNNTTGSNNISIGKSSLYFNISGSSNIGIGIESLYGISSSRNIAVGNYTAGTGSDNISIGDSAMNNCNGSYNVAIGTSAMSKVTGGSYNTVIGYRGLNWSNTGNNNTYIGYGTESVSGDNEIVLGNSSITTLNCAVTSITSLSDKRDKSEIKNITEGIDFVKKLNPVTFTWNTRDKAKVGIKAAGFIAQDLLELQNNSKIGENLDLVSSDNPEKLEARYSNLIPVLVKAIQELNVQNELQQKEIEKLKLMVAKDYSENK